MADHAAGADWKLSRNILDVRTTWTELRLHGVRMQSGALGPGFSG